MFAKCTNDNGLVSRINKELIELNNKKKNNAEKLENDLNVYLTK